MGPLLIKVFRKTEVNVGLSKTLHSITFLTCCLQRSLKRNARRQKQNSVFTSNGVAAFTNATSCLQSNDTGTEVREAKFTYLDIIYK